MSKVRWGVIAAGGIADRRTIPGLMLANNAELVAVMEVNMEIAEKIRAKYGCKYAYDNVDALLANPEIDAVYIASPVLYHKEQAIKAAKAKKHILLEKPICMTIEEGDEVVAVCQAEGVLFATGLMMRYHGYHKAMKQMVADGKLGKVVSARAQLTCWYPDMPGNWRQDPKQSGGGSMMDMGIHCLDLIQYITGEKIVSVASLNKTLQFNYAVEDSSSSLFELSGGGFGYVDTNFNIPDEAAHCRLEIYGTKGSMLAEGTIGQIEAGKVEVTLSADSKGYDAQQDRQDNGSFVLTADLGNMYTKQMESFSNSILTGAPVEVPATDALYDQKVIFAAYESTKTRKFVEVK